MSKRRPVLVPSASSASSEDDGDKRGGPSGSRPAAPPRSRKRPRARSASGSRLHKASPSSRGLEAVKFDMLSEDFSDCLNDFCITPGLTVNDGKELWVDKHKPHCLADLAVHKKKVREVKVWLEDKLKTSKEGPGNCTLVITGQSGVGKSMAIHVIASELGAELYEWTTPTPTLWQEHIHNSGLGIHYVSKLEEFEMFMEKIRKYSLLCPTYTGGSSKPVLLIDDLPTTNGRVAFVRLSRCLATLAQSTQVPTVISITEYCKSESGDSSNHYWEDLVSSLEKAGAYKVAFNPLTVNSIKKALLRICQEENCSLSAELVDQIAEASGGDIRHAIMSLQYCCLRPEKCFHLPIRSLAATDCKINSKARLESVSTFRRDGDPNAKISLPFGRDDSLTLFHALGKFLHNKRETIDISAPGPDSFILQEKLVRKQPKMDAPEKILSQAHGQARPIVDFLHENVLDFLSEEAVGDASLVISYLSDADCILATALRPTWPRMVMEKYDPESVAQSVAASVAVRGVLFGNSRPSSSWWHAIRRPRLWQIEQSSRHNKHQMVMERWVPTVCDVSEIATEYRPRAGWLGSRISKDVYAREELLYNSNNEDYMSDLMDADSEASEDDEIEDW